MIASSKAIDSGSEQDFKNSDNRKDKLRKDVENYIASIYGIPLLTPEKERELGWRRINDEDQGARNELVNGNLRLVVSIAKKYSGRSLSFSDLIDEGNIGLLNAANAYDPARGTRFSTYAHKAIKQQIERALTHEYAQSRILPQPDKKVFSACELFDRYKDECALENKPFDKKQMVSRIADSLEIERNKAESILRKVFLIQSSKKISLDVPLRSSKAGKEVDYSEILPSRVKSSNNDVRSSLVRELELILEDSGIDERDKDLFRARFGLDGRGQKTLVGSASATEVSLTRERVRKIIERVERSLRDNSVISDIDELV